MQNEFGRLALACGVRAFIAVGLILVGSHLAQAGPHSGRGKAEAAASGCPAIAAPPYAGPIFDAMAQTDQSLDAEAALATARAEGVVKLALFARVHRHQDGRGLVDHLAAKYPDFIVRGAPKEWDMPRDLPSIYIDEVLAGVASGHFRFVGEIIYTEGNKGEGEVTEGGERYTDPTLPGTKHLLDGLAGTGIPVMMHWEAYSWARDWPHFDRLYSAYPNQIFVLPHLAFASHDQAAEVLAAHPNVWATISKKDKDNVNLVDEDKEEETGESLVDECSQLKPEWRDLLVRYSTRLMFATDAHKERRWVQYVEIIRRWRAILGQLPPDVAAAIAHGNAERLYRSPIGN
ncbi:MAG: amidohydrolase family protein [Acetobacteraceae bacterium]|nr:amidohydrolase family protein [Acetobacteraceae bacterium]